MWWRHFIGILFFTLIVAGWTTFYHPKLHLSGKSLIENFELLHFEFDGSAKNADEYSKLTPTHKLWVDPIKIAPLRVSPSRTLVTVGDTIYMLDAWQKIIWKWDVGSGQNIMDKPIVDSHGFIYGIALDGIIFSLDENGQLRWTWRLNGASNFFQIKPYVNGQYLVVRDNSSYREVQGFDEDDGLYLCKDRDVITTIDFPRNAILRVQGKRIYAVIKSKHGTRIKEVTFRS